LGPGRPPAQRIHTRRQAVGDQRAGQIEALLHALLPGAIVEWNPQLAIRVGSGPATRVDVGDFAVTRQPDGMSDGVALVELGSAKADYIAKLGRFQASNAETFTTTIVAFRLDSSGKVSDLKQVLVDPTGPVSKVNWFEVKTWPVGKWPVLRLRYSSYIRGNGSLTTLEWGSLLNVGTGAFLSRLPTGIFITYSSGGQTADMLSAHRSSSTEIQIVGNFHKKGDRLSLH